MALFCDSSQVMSPLSSHESLRKIGCIMNIKLLSCFVLVICHVYISLALIHYNLPMSWFTIMFLSRNTNVTTHALTFSIQHTVSLDKIALRNTNNTLFYILFPTHCIIGWNPRCYDLWVCGRPDWLYE
jgi:hypothetical protein